MPLVERKQTQARSNARLSATLAAAAAAIGLCFGGVAYAADPVELMVLDRETDQVLDVFSQDAQRFVAGQTGSRYALRVRNNTGRRVMVVISVDGVNIVSGETAAHNQTGYILHPGRSYDLTGWRKTQDEVAAFVFSPLPKSYAALTGRPSNVGVIGMAVFEERPSPSPGQAVSSINLRNLGSGRTLLELNGRRVADDSVAVGSRSRGNAEAQALPVEVIGREDFEARGNPTTETIIRDLSEVGNVQGQSARGSTAGGYGAAPPPPASPVPPPPPSPRPVTPAPVAERIGTGHGAIERSHSPYENFVRASAQPAYEFEVRYDTRDNLIASGVIPRNFTPQRFVPDPPVAR